MIKAPHKKLCAYCNLRDAETMDHVPPKNLFPNPRPQNLITVPACHVCNNKFSDDEEYFIASIMFSNAGVSDAGKKLWQQKLHRMYSKNQGIRKRMARTLRRKSLYTPAGLYIGKHMVQSPDLARWDRVIEKVVRGLYYFEYGSSLSPDTPVVTLYISSPERHREMVEKNINSLNVGRKGWVGIFRYKFNRLEEEPKSSMWGLLFYEDFIYWAITDET